MTIFDKLKLKKYQKMAVVNQPSEYHIFTDEPTTVSKDHDAIFIFVEALDEMVMHIQSIVKNEQLLLENGYLFIAYPKKGNKRFKTFIHRDEMFPALNVGEDGYVGDSDIKFARMVSMDDVFTVVGLKREKKKINKSSLAASQCVADYEDHIKDVERLLANHPNENIFYQKLTPGYQKDWARYIYSAKQQQTRDKRYLQMVDILSQGYKSMDLFRQKKK
ncbi:YdeI/OmpD-associated family protein [Fictibacillus sp. KIGAM418]|uniref:YdeI/OmpD-associated family protein n=1 Tax=Fictibacillus marinisediminis TaxID=2878389 RepID=A0A9X2BH96_9BACL|nr:YdeI/OmpD-associated family protein [Fictibacillus marinisediminis]MCK6257383.1 YdeI/OmpD-associated family protein [Fictibacillus marinisediminis]